MRLIQQSQKTTGACGSDAAPASASAIWLHDWRNIAITLKPPFLGLAGVNERNRLVSSTILRSD
jgi:hypothetical protein